MAGIGIGIGIGGSAYSTRCSGGIRMRYLFATILPCLLVACGSVPPPISGSGCSTKSQCEIEAYMNAR